MKRNNITSIIVLLFFIFPMLISHIGEDLGSNSQSNSFDYARITDVEYKAEVVDTPNSKGKVIITERLTFDIHAASKSNLFWELWRALPESTVDGAKVEYKVNSVKQIVDKNEEVIYTESPKLYWNDSDYTNTKGGYGPGKWYHSKGPYDEDARRYECVLFYVDGLYREKVVFEIEYEMYNAALRYNDCSELYLSMYSEETIKYLKSYKGQILIPNSKMPEKGNYEAYTFGTNSNTFPYTESKTVNPGYHTFSFELDESQLKFKPYNQYIEFTLLAYGEDKHKFTEYASKNDYYYDNVLDECRNELEEYNKLPESYKILKEGVLVCSIILACVVLTSHSRSIKKLNKKYTFYEPEMQMEYFRDIPSDLDPHFAADLVFCKEKNSKYKKDEYAALMLSLVRKKYIELERISVEKDWEFKNIKIIVKYKPELQNNVEGENVEQTNKLEPLTQNEGLYFNLIVKYASKQNNNNEIPLKTFQDFISKDYQSTDNFVRNVDNSTSSIGMSNGYFQKSNYKDAIEYMNGKAVIKAIMGVLVLLVNVMSFKTRLDLAYGSFFILGISYFISCILHVKKSRKYILLTQLGENEYSKWRGLYNFLNSETLMSEKTVIEVTLWEKYLVYATAFGISEKVIKALKIKAPDVQNSAMLSNNYYRSVHFISHSHSFRTATHHASSVARSGSYGYGGHGGYGGRRKRRPEAVAEVTRK